MLGIWDNFADLESKINLRELELIVDAAREQEYKRNKFAAALKGVDLDAPGRDDVQQRFDAARIRAEARLTGKSAETLELDALGIEVETE